MDGNGHIKRRVAWILLAMYTLSVMYWMLWGFGRSVQAEIRYNLVPMMTVHQYAASFRADHYTGPMINLAGNIGVFVPFGVLLPYLFKKLRKLPLFLIYFTAAIVMMELVQTVLKVGAGDIDDVILNDIGGLIGYYATTRLWMNRSEGAESGGG